MTSSLQQIEDLLERVLDAVKKAADSRNVDALPNLSQLSQRLKTTRERCKELDKELADLESECASLCGPLNGQTPVLTEVNTVLKQDNPLVNEQYPEKRTMRCLVVNVTQGMINQNLLTLTEHVHAGRIRSGTEMKIEAHPSGEIFSTMLLSDGNRLQERGAIARFYHDARVRAGDQVVLTQDVTNRWTLVKLHSGIPQAPLMSNESDDFI